MDGKTQRRGEEMLIENIKSCCTDTKANISIVLKDLTNDRWIYTLNENRIVSSASTIKILIMIEALNQVLEGKYQLKQKVRIKEEDKVGFSIVKDLTADYYNYVDLITLMIIVSDNTATNILIDLLGYDNINKMAEKLGLKNTILSRKMLEFKAIKEGRQNCTSPMDMAIIMESIYRKQILSHDMCELMTGILKKQKYKDCLGRFFSEDVKIAHKTGSLKNLSHDIGIFYLGSIDYLLGMFVTEASSDIEAKEIIGKVSKVVYDYYS